MSITRRDFLTTSLCAGSLSLIGLPAMATPLQQRSWNFFGTRVDVSLKHTDAELMNQAFDTLYGLFDKAHKDFHPWEPGLLSQVNDAFSQGESIKVSPGIIDMLGEIQALFRSSGGYFNPAMGQLSSSWGFLGDTDQHWQPPSESELRAALITASSPEDLRIEAGSVSSANPSLKLDLGGYAKGYALKEAAGYLHQAGIQHAIIDAGGDVLALGHDWQAGIRYPFKDDVMIRFNTVRDEAIFTSRNHLKYQTHEGSRYTHILDPRSGRPVNELLSATVVHESASVADAAATALMAAGKSEWKVVADAMGVMQAMVIDSDGVFHYSPSMKGRLRS